MLSIVVVGCCCRLLSIVVGGGLLSIVVVDCVLLIVAEGPHVNVIDQVLAAAAAAASPRSTPNAPSPDSIELEGMDDDIALTLTPPPNAP